MRRFLLSRKGLAALIALVLVSFALHLVAFRGGRMVHSDTNWFLEVVSYIKGEPLTGNQVPQRISSPMYPFDILLVRYLVRDWLLSARIAAMIPSILLPCVICLVAWALDERFWSGVFAGFVAATSLSLLRTGITPLSESTFIFFSAVMLLAAILFLRKPSVLPALALGIAAGCAYAARGQGLFYCVVILISILLGAWTAGRANGRPGESRRLRPLLHCVLFVLAFVLVGRGPTKALQNLGRGLQPSEPYTKAVLLDGILYTEQAASAQRLRNQLRYRLNEDCTDLLFADEVRLPWSGILKKYWKRLLRMYFVNFKLNLVRELPRAMTPFIVLFFPLALGMSAAAKRGSPAIEALLALFAAIYVFFIPAIQLHARYVVPITAAAFPLVGMGFARMLFPDDRKRPGKQAITRILSLLMLAFLLVNAAKWAYSRSVAPDLDKGYRAACAWIRAKRLPRDVGVMARYRAVYAYARQRTVVLPIDAPERVARYCANAKVSYLLLGPVERKHNPDLAALMDAADAKATVGNFVFRVVQSFGEGDGRVLVIEPRRRESESGDPDARS